MLKVSSPKKRKEMQKNKEKAAAKGEKMKEKIKKRNKQEEKIPATDANRKYVFGIQSERGLERLCITVSNLSLKGRPKPLFCLSCLQEFFLPVYFSF